MSGTGNVRFLPKALPRYLAPRHAARASARFRDLGRMVALATVLVAAPVLAPSPAQAVTVAVYEGSALQFYAQDGEGGSGTGEGRRVTDTNTDSDDNQVNVDASNTAFTGSDTNVRDLKVEVDPTNNKMTVSGSIEIGGSSATTTSRISIYAYASGQSHMLDDEILFSTKTSGDRMNDGEDWDTTVSTRIATWVTTSSTVIDDETDESETVNVNGVPQPSSSSDLSNYYSHWVAGSPFRDPTANCLLYASGRRACNTDYVAQISQLAMGTAYSAHALIEFNMGLMGKSGLGDVDFRLVFDYGVIPLPPALWAMGAALGLFGFAGAARRRRANNASKEPLRGVSVGQCTE